MVVLFLDIRQQEVSIASLETWLQLEIQLIDSSHGNGFPAEVSCFFKERKSCRATQRFVFIFFSAGPATLLRFSLYLGEEGRRQEGFFLSFLLLEFSSSLI